MNGPFRVTLLLAGILSAAGCVTQDGPTPLEGAQRVVLADGSGLSERDRSRFLPALEALSASVEEGRDDEARRILRRLAAMAPPEEVVQLMDAFERILDGRAVVARLETALIAQEVAERPGDYRVFLAITANEPEDVVFGPAGARLVVTYTSVDPVGSEQRAVQHTTIEGVADLTLAPGDESTLPLIEVTAPAPTGMLALDANFRLEFLAGEVRTGGRALPVNEFPSPSVSVVRLAGYLPTAALPPEELVRYVEAGDVKPPALLERAVRIPPELREETLDALEPLVERLPTPELGELVPALRWLSGTSAPGGDPGAWRAWMADRRRRGEVAAESNPPAGALDLPRTR